MSLIDSLGRKFHAEIVGRVIGTIAGGILTILLARLLNPNGYGLLFLALSIFSAAQIGSRLGIAKSAARYISEYREKDPGQIAYIIERSFLINILSILVVLSFFIVFQDLISSIMNEPDLQPFLGIGSLFVAFSAIVFYTNIIAQSFEDIVLSAGIRATDNILRLIIVIIIVSIGYGALGALIGYVISALIASLIGSVLIFTRHYRNLSRASKMESGLFRRISEYTIPLTFTGIAGKLDREFDTILIGFFLNPVAVSYYVVSKQIVDFIQIPSAALGFSVSPIYGSMKADDKLDQAAKLYEETLNKTLLVYLPAATGVLLLAEPGIEIVFGPDYNGAVPLLQVFSIYVILKAITKITDQSLDYLGRAKEKSIASGVTAIANVILNIILIPTFGVLGAAISTILTYSVYVSIKLFVVYKEIPLDLTSIMGNLSRTSLITVCMAIPVIIFSPNIEGFISLALVIFSGIGVWGSLSYIFKSNYSQELEIN